MGLHFYPQFLGDYLTEPRKFEVLHIFHKCLMPHFIGHNACEAVHIFSYTNIQKDSTMIKNNKKVTVYKIRFVTKSVMARIMLRCTQSLLHIHCCWKGTPVRCIFHILVWDGDWTGVLSYCFSHLTWESMRQRYLQLRWQDISVRPKQHAADGWYTKYTMPFGCLLQCGFKIRTFLSQLNPH